MNNFYWSGSNFAFGCLVDYNRTECFRKEIECNVKNGDVIVEAGAGTGILSLFAAKYGASKVYAIERDPDLVSYLKSTVVKNGYQNIIEVAEEDASNITLPENVDGIICEMISTCLITEFQIPVMNNLLNFAKDNCFVIPEEMENYISLVSQKSEFWGFNMNPVQYLYQDHSELKSEILSVESKFFVIDFNHYNKNPKVNVDMEIPITNEGIINGIRLTNRTIFPANSELISSDFYCNPVVLPTNEIHVSEKDRCRVKLEYYIHKGFKNMYYDIYKM